MTKISMSRVAALLRTLRLLSVVFLFDLVTTSQIQAADQWGTYTKPFAADSMWNSRPVEPVLGSYTLPKTRYYPALGEGTYSTGAFLATETDEPVTINDIWSPDDESRISITIPRWPK